MNKKNTLYMCMCVCWSNMLLEGTQSEHKSSILFKAWHQRLRVPGG
jgi:hypothetical protein